VIETVLKTLAHSKAALKRQGTEQLCSPHVVNGANCGCACRAMRVGATFARSLLAFHVIPELSHKLLHAPVRQMVGERVYDAVFLVVRDRFCYVQQQGLQRSSLLATNRPQHSLYFCSEMIKSIDKGHN
jgi:hypothetical protein